MPSKQICIFVYHIGDVLVRMAGEVPIEPCALLGFKSKMLLDKLFDGFGTLSQPTLSGRATRGLTSASSKEGKRVESPPTFIRWFKSKMLLDKLFDGFGTLSQPTLGGRATRGLTSASSKEGKRAESPPTFIRGKC